MAKQVQETRERILEVATQIFYQKGLHGARMKEIADGASINKAMLHYYFNTKEQLFDAVFAEAIGILLPALRRFYEGAQPLEQKIERLIDEYTGLLSEHPQVPVFVLSELRMHPEKFRQMSQNAPFQTDIVIGQIKAEIAAGRLRPIDPRHFVMSLFSTCIFPYISGIVWQGLFQLDDAGFQEMMATRKASLMMLFWESLRC